MLPLLLLLLLLCSVIGCSLCPFNDNDAPPSTSWSLSQTATSSFSRKVALLLLDMKRGRSSASRALKHAVGAPKNAPQKTPPQEGPPRVHPRSSARPPSPPPPPPPPPPPTPPPPPPTSGAFPPRPTLSLSPTSEDSSEVKRPPAKRPKMRAKPRCSARFVVPSPEPHHLPFPLRAAPLLFDASRGESTASAGAPPKRKQLRDAASGSLSFGRGAWPAVPGTSSSRQDLSSGFDDSDLLSLPKSAKRASQYGS